MADDLTKKSEIKEQENTPEKIELKGEIGFYKKAIELGRGANYLQKRGSPLEKYFSPEQLARIDKMHEEIDSLGERAFGEDKYADEIYINQEQGRALFIDKAQRHLKMVKTVQNSKKSVNLFKITKNLRIVLIVFMAFLGFIAFKYLMQGQDELSELNAQVNQIQKSLPIQLLPDTKLIEASVKGDEYIFTVAKDASSFADTNDLDLALDSYIKGTSDNFCRIELFQKLIKLDKKISVKLIVEQKALEKNFSITTCIQN